MQVSGYAPCAESQYASSSLQEEYQSERQCCSIAGTAGGEPGMNKCSSHGLYYLLPPKHPDTELKVLDVAKQPSAGAIW